MRGPTMNENGCKLGSIASAVPAYQLKYSIVLNGLCYSHRTTCTGLTDRSSVNTHRNHALNDAPRHRSLDREDPAAGSNSDKPNRRGRREKSVARARLPFPSRDELAKPSGQISIFLQNPRKTSTNARRRTGALREVFVRFNDAPTSQ
jgi:hypothetical protein